jgi:hypothetical protein
MSNTLKFKKVFAGEYVSTCNTYKIAIVEEGCDRNQWDLFVKNEDPNSWDDWNWHTREFTKKNCVLEANTFNTLYKKR